MNVVRFFRVDANTVKRFLRTDRNVIAVFADDYKQTIWDRPDVKYIYKCVLLKCNADFSAININRFNPCINIYYFRIFSSQTLIWILLRFSNGNTCFEFFYLKKRKNYYFCFYGFQRVFMLVFVDLLGKHV